MIYWNRKSVDRANTLSQALCGQRLVGATTMRRHSQTTIIAKGGAPGQNREVNMIEGIAIILYVNQWLEQEVEYQVVCSGETTKTGCGSSSGFHDTEEKAIEAWNRAWNRRAI